MWKRFMQSLGENSISLLIASFFIGVFLIAQPLHAQDNDYCINWAKNDLKLEVTPNFALSGPELVSDTWRVPHDTITIQFGQEPPMVWTSNEVFKVGLMDYIGTAANFEEKTGTPAFAGRNEEGFIWIISKMGEPGEPNTIPCLAHPFVYSK